MDWFFLGIGFLRLEDLLCADASFLWTLLRVSFTFDIFHIDFDRSGLLASCTSVCLLLEGALLWLVRGQLLLWHFCLCLCLCGGSCSICWLGDGRIVVLQLQGLDVPLQVILRLVVVPALIRARINDIRNPELLHGGTRRRGFVFTLLLCNACHCRLFGGDWLLLLLRRISLSLVFEIAIPLSDQVLLLY